MKWLHRRRAHGIGLTVHGDDMLAAVDFRRAIRRAEERKRYEASHQPSMMRDFLLDKVHGYKEYADRSHMYDLTIGRHQYEAFELEDYFEAMVTVDPRAKIKMELGFEDRR